MAVFAAIAVAMFLFCFGLTKERVQPVVEQKTSTRRDLLDLVTNVPG